MVDVNALKDYIMHRERKGEALYASSGGSPSHSSHQQPHAPYSHQPVSPARGRRGSLTSSEHLFGHHGGAGRVSGLSVSISDGQQGASGGIGPHREYAFLNSEVENLRQLTRRIELHQSEDLEMFSHVKKLQEGVKALNRELMRLDQHPHVVALGAALTSQLENQRKSSQAHFEQTRVEVRVLGERLVRVEGEAVAGIAERVSAVEDKMMILDFFVGDSAGRGGGGGSAKSGSAADLSQTSIDEEDGVSSEEEEEDDDQFGDSFIDEEEEDEEEEGEKKEQVGEQTANEVEAAKTGAKTEVELIETKLRNEQEDSSQISSLSPYGTAAASTKTRSLSMAVRSAAAAVSEQSPSAEPNSPFVIGAGVGSAKSLPGLGNGSSDVLAELPGERVKITEKEKEKEKAYRRKMSAFSSSFCRSVEASGMGLSPAEGAAGGTVRSRRSFAGHRSFVSATGSARKASAPPSSIGPAGALGAPPVDVARRRTMRGSTSALSTQSSFSSIASAHSAASKSRRSIRGSMRSPSFSRRGAPAVPGETPQMRKRRESLKKSAFFQSMMSDYVNQTQFHAAQQEVGEIVGRSFRVVLQLMRGQAHQLLLHGLEKMYAQLERDGVARAFRTWAEDVKYYVQKRYCRLEKNTLLFQLKMSNAYTRHLQRCWFERWRWRVDLDYERDRLRLHLRNVLQRWHNFRRVDLREYMLRWKRFVVHSYQEDAFSDDESMLLTGNTVVYL